MIPKRRNSCKERIANHGCTLTSIKFKRMFDRWEEVQKRRRSWMEQCLHFMSNTLVPLLLLMTATYGCSTFESPKVIQGPSPERTPEEELATFQVEAGL